MRYLAALILTCVVGVVLLWQVYPTLNNGPIENDFALCATAFEPDSIFDEDLAAAIKRVNPLLNSKHHLFVLNEKNRESEFAAPIPVYSARASVTGNMLVQVPVDCPVIVFNSSAFYQGVKATLGEDVSATNIQQMLAFLLLHEVGHIHHKHHGQFLPAGSELVTNLSNTLSKELESEADEFVVDIIRPRIAGDIDDPLFTAHQLMNFVGYLSFVISGQNSIECFGCRTIGSKDIFWDHSQTHENLELRLLKINHALYPTDTSEQMLQDFEAQRNDSRQPRILYVDPDIEGEVSKTENGLGLDIDLGADLDIPRLLDSLDLQSEEKEE